MATSQSHGDQQVTWKASWAFCTVVSLTTWGQFWRHSKVVLDWYFLCCLDRPPHHQIDASRRAQKIRVTLLLEGDFSGNRSFSEEQEAHRTLSWTLPV